jgi:cytochrome P450
MVATASTLPPGPRPRIPGALEIAFWRDPTGRLTEMARRYGDASCFRFGPYLEFLLVEPELVRAVLQNSRSFAKGNALQQAKRVLGEGLLTSEGELHLRQRRLIQPIFHQKRVAGYAETMVSRTERMLERWQPGAAVDVHAEMTRLTLAVVGDTLFGADVEGEAEEIGAALTESLAAVNRLVFPFVGPAMERLPLPSRRRFRHSIARLDATIERLIDERRGRPGGADLLSMLLEARGEDGAPMPDRQVRDEAMTLFLAGHETTANLLTWAWYLLSQHPEAEARLQAEVDAVVGSERPRFEHVSELEFVRRVVDEALRLYPPAWVIGRRALEDVDLGTVQVPAGAIVVLSPFVTHRDARWFPEPLRFDPDRWLPASRERIPAYAFFPFGGGKRICIGESFARVEATLVLATVARRWSLRLEPGHPVELLPRVTLRPKHGMRMVLARRG